MGIIVIVAYRPIPGKEEALDAEMGTHVPILRSEGLATDRESIVMRAKDGTVVEVFEWVSAAAIEAAHNNPAVLAMWGRYAACCTFESVGNLEEAKELFSSFEPMN